MTKHLSRLATLALLLLAACCHRPSADSLLFNQIDPGWSKKEVIELVGEPSGAQYRPFKDRMKNDCRDSAATELVFEREESTTFFVYLDENDTVLCVIEGFRLLQV